MVGCRRSRDLRLAREYDEPDAQALGYTVEEHLHRLLRRSQPRGLHVRGLHRARGVEDEDHRRTLARDHAVHVRARDADEERGEREREQDRRHVAAPLASFDHGREDVEVRVPDGVPGAAPLREEPEPYCKPDDEQ